MMCDSLVALANTQMYAHICQHTHVNTHSIIYGSALLHTFTAQQHVLVFPDTCANTPTHTPYAHNVPTGICYQMTGKWTK